MMTLIPVPRSPIVWTDDGEDEDERVSGASEQHMDVECDIANDPDFPPVGQWTLIREAPDIKHNWKIRE